MKKLSPALLPAALWIIALAVVLPQLATRCLGAAWIAPRSSAYDFRVDTLLFHAPIRVLGFDTVNAGFAIALLLGVVLLIGEIGRRAFSSLEQASFSSLAALQAFAGIALAFSPVAFSPDPTAYVLYTRLYGVFGVNPYRAPLNVPHDHVLSTVAAFWIVPPLPANVYGPLWTLVVSAIAHLEATMSLGGQWMTQRFIAVLASVIASAGLFHIMRRRGDAREALTRVASFAFHPLVLLETAVDGHNDIVMIACAIWAFALLEEAPLAAGALLGASIAVKYVSIVVAPFFLVMLWHAHGRRIRAAVTAFAGAGAVLLVSFAPFWFGARTLQPILNNESDVSGSPPALLADIYLAALRKSPTDPVFPGQTHWHVFRHATAGLFVDFAFVGAWLLLAAILFYRFARTRNLSLPYLAATSFLAVIPAIAPYYLIWLSPLLVEQARWGRYVRYLLAAALVYYVQCLMGNIQKETAADIYAAALLIIPFVAMRFGRRLQRENTKGAR